MKYRQLLIRLFTFLGGVYFFFKFILPEKVTISEHSFEFGKYNDQITNGLSAVGVAALGIGLVILFVQHGGALLRRRQGWIYSGALLAGLVAMLSISAIDWRQSAAVSNRTKQFAMLRDFTTVIGRGAAADELTTAQLEEKLRLLQQAAEREFSLLQQDISIDVDSTREQTRQELLALIANGREAVAANDLDRSAVALAALMAPTAEFLQARQKENMSRKLYGILYNGLFISLGSAMFSLLGFYIASAAYRAFRIRSPEAALMMLGAFIVILGQIPTTLFGSSDAVVQFFASLNQVRFWVLSQINTAAFRAIEIGAAVATLVMSLRMWLSIESQSFGEKKEGK